MAPRVSPGGKDNSASGLGVDATLIEWMLRLSPEERLQVLQDHVTLVTSLRRGKDTD
jgi:hypothetical protein